MKRGPRPEPTNLKLLKGNPGRRPIRPEPKPTPKAPRMPDWLPEPAQKRWKELAPELEKVGLLTAADGEALSFTLMSWWTAVEAAKVLIGEGLLTEDSKGQIHKHPAHQIYRDCSAGFRQWCAEFGLTPSARTRLTIPESEEDDALLDAQ